MASVAGIVSVPDADRGSIEERDVVPGILSVFGPVWGSVEYFASFDAIVPDHPFTPFIHLWVSDGGSLDLTRSLVGDFSLMDVTIFADSEAALTVRTGAGNERFVGSAGDNQFHGGDGADWFNASAGTDRLMGEGGDDRGGFAGQGTGVFDGGSGSDTLELEFGATYRFVGQADAFSVIASTGKVLHVRDVETLIDHVGHGGVSMGTDAILFESGVTVTGTDGRDVIGLLAALADGSVATMGDDVLRGGAGADDVRGGTGDDQIAGETGADVLAGGEGADAFVFDAAGWTAADADRILDFRSGEDAIWLDDAAFAALASDANGALAAGQLVLGTRALDADDHLVYDQASGRLWYDADGSGRDEGRVLVAKLGGGKALDADDLVLV